MTVSNFEAKTMVMPYGKHKGKFIKDLPWDYLKWLYANIEPNLVNLKLLETVCILLEEGIDKNDYESIGI